jgi:hypothetical protein
MVAKKMLIKQDLKKVAIICKVTETNLPGSGGIVQTKRICWSLIKEV